MKIFALSGSLRAASVNTALLEAVAARSPPNIRVSVYEGLRDLPLFNPDIAFTPRIVANFQHRFDVCDALLIASPEYAHGVTGAIKNALDWLVGFERSAGKPVAVLNASDRASHADKSLRETLDVMGLRIVQSASLTIPIPDSGLDAARICNIPQAAQQIDRCLLALRDNFTSHLADRALSDHN